jgi:hypothetical protein
MEREETSYYRSVGHDFVHYSAEFLLFSLGLSNFKVVFERLCTFGGLISWKGTRERGNPRNKLNKSPKTNVT